MQPMIEVTQNTFKMILTNRNKSVPTEKNDSRAEKTEQMQVILDYIAQYGEINNEKVQEILSVKRTRAYTILKQMVDNGFVTANGRGEEKKYYAVGR